MQVRGGQSLCSSDSHIRVLQCRDERTHDVSRRCPCRVKHDDDGATCRPDPGFEGIARAPRLHGAHHHIGRRVEDPCVGRHDHDLGVGRPMCRERFEYRARMGFGGDDDHAGRGRGWALDGRDRIERAVDRHSILDQIRRAQRLQIVGRTVIDDLPAGGFEARLQLVGAGEIASRAGLRTRVGKLDDLGGD